MPTIPWNLGKIADIVFLTVYSKEEIRPPPW